MAGAQPGMPQTQATVLNVSGPVRVVDYGGPDDGVPVVCVHGLGGSATNWHALAPLLAADRRVVAFDLPGHGSSRAGTGSALADAQRVLDAVVQSVAADRPVTVVAHSFGATAAVAWATKAPQRVQRLALLAPPLPKQPRFDLAIAVKQFLLQAPGIEGIVRRKVAALSPHAAVAKQIEQATPHPERVAPEVVAAAVDEFAARRADGTDDAAQRRQWQMIAETMTLLRDGKTYAGTIAALPVAGAWLHGAEDPLSLPPVARRFASLQPSWTFHEVADAGHLLHAEQSTRVAEILERELG